MTPAVTPAKTMLMRSAATLSVVVMAVVMAGCSSGPTTHASTSTSVTRATGSASTTTASSPASATQTAVLNAWESAEQTLYGYLQGSWQQDRSDLVGGETSANLWPKLADYFANPALQSEDEFLVGVKMGQLNGPNDLQPRPSDGHRRYSHLGDGNGLHLRHGHDDSLRTAWPTNSRTGAPAAPAELGNFSSSTGRGGSPTFTR